MKSEEWHWLPEAAGKRMLTFWVPMYPFTSFSPLCSISVVCLFSSRKWGRKNSHLGTFSRKDCVNRLTHPLALLFHVSRARSCSPSTLARQSPPSGRPSTGRGRRGLASSSLTSSTAWRQSEYKQTHQSSVCV